MKILFLSYWGIHEGLSAATVLPHLKILSEFGTIEKIIFCSIERGGHPVTPADMGEKIIHIPLYSRPGSSLLTKWNDFFFFPKQLRRLCRQYSVDLILCRSSLAGALGYLVSRGNNLPYAVESFEPHADYMVDSGVWHKHDTRTLIQRYFERKIKTSAMALLPVSQHYEQKLFAEGVDIGKVIVLPCCVSLPMFAFRPGARVIIRKKYAIDDTDTVGVYAGKFGGIYYNDEAFRLYQQAFEFFGNQFYLFLLTADAPEALSNKIAKFELPAHRVTIIRVLHHEVADYLSAADFAFSTIRPAPSRIYCSPIKNGEYWANGLPVLLEDNIGMDSDIIKNEGGGVLMDMTKPNEAFLKIKALLKTPREVLASEIQHIAYKYRRIELVKEAYQRFLDL
ncbi:MAG TPA: glycosyltransferase [Ohtaekwangia sp.]|nr:glycosyltransferase [Ohtaekwangia sp.]